MGPPASKYAVSRESAEIQPFSRSEEHAAVARGVEDPLSEIAKTEAFRHVVVALGFGYDKASRKRIRRVDTNLGRNRTGVLQPDR